MSNPHLPPEMLDHIVDLLHDTKHALRNCCIVSKSWIPRARKHLFADIRFCVAEDLQSWSKMFPDPSTSPARYAKTLFVGRFHAFNFDALVDSFVPSHGFSPAIRSLHLDLIHLPPQTFDLIISFPFLEELAVSGGSFDGPPTVVQPSSSPVFTGSLELSLEGGMKPIAHRLLSLPGRLHFRKLTLTCNHEEDPLLTMELVEECSHTLESLDIAYPVFYRTFIRHLHSRI